MDRDIRQWHVENETRPSASLPLSSISEAVEALIGISEKPVGETLDFVHSQRGLISCTAGNGWSTLTFVCDYNKNRHSLSRKRIAQSDNRDGEYHHADSTGLVSSVPPLYVLPLLQVVRALVYIFEFHDVPLFLDWSDPVPDEL
jgi:hypothetical protein